ncbi:peptidylprolyl isomerase [Streptomyces sp. NPDC057702]|uniref:peptidylprolyl isomerase n=1 Tax=unclassified Streptomyces TaxID=2593676 RepID=UPI00367DE34D
MVSQEQRRRQLAREKLERQQRRKAATRSKTRKRNAAVAGGVVLALVAGLVVAAVGLFDSDDDTDKAKAKACAEPAEGTPSGKTWKKEPKVTIDTSATYTMELATTCGDITIAMDAKKAPHTVNSFNFLAGQGYFDHTRCHRLTDQGIHVLQCGDPKGDGTGTPGYTIPDENLKDPRLKGNVYPAGTIAMANRYNPQPTKGESKNENSGGSQFFIVYQDSELPPYYTPFGTLAGGKDALDKITKAGATAPDPQTGNTAPVANVVINKATVKRS